MDSIELFRRTIRHADLPPAEQQRLLMAALEVLRGTKKTTPERQPKGSNSPEVLAMREKILEAFDFTQPPQTFMTIDQVCFAIGLDNPTRGEQGQCGCAIKLITNQPAYRTSAARLHKMPPLRV